MAKDHGAKKPIRPADYQRLAAFRHTLRRFLAFSEAAARAAGITPQQHQALLAIKGVSGRETVTVGYLADQLLLQPHSAAELVDRMVKSGFLLRAEAPDDRRRVVLSRPPPPRPARAARPPHRPLSRPPPPRPPSRHPPLPPNPLLPPPQQDTSAHPLPHSPHPPRPVPTPHANLNCAWVLAWRVFTRVGLRAHKRRAWWDAMGDPRKRGRSNPRWAWVSSPIMSFSSRARRGAASKTQASTRRTNASAPRKRGRRSAMSQNLCMCCVANGYRRRARLLSRRKL